MRRAGFTLIELMLVMAMLVAVLGVTFPSLKRFFQGRTIDSEARRILSLTRYGQSRAISEGMPMVLWIDTERKAYGLQVQTGYVDVDTNAVEYNLAGNLTLDVQLPLLSTISSWRPTLPGMLNIPMIRFLPDGSIGQTSPEAIMVRQDPDEEIWIVAATNRLRYAIQTDHALAARR